MTRHMKVSMVGVLAVALLTLFAVAGCSSPGTDGAGQGASDGSGGAPAREDSANANSSEGGASASVAQGEQTAIEDGALVKVPNGWVAYSQGDMLVLLDSSASTGYQWTASVEGPSVLKDTDADLPSSTYYDQSSNDVVGSAGMHVFGFLAKDSGDSTVTMKLANTADASQVNQTIVLKASVENGTFSAVNVQES